MSRVLETVITGRNLLSPVLAEAGRDVAAFNSTVSGANEKAAASATASARAQQAAAGQTSAASAKAATAATTGASTQSAAADKIAASNVKASTSASTSATTQARAHAKAAESATLSARTQESANRALAASNGLLGTSLTPLTAGLGAVGLGLGYAAYRGMDFDSAMSQVQAASQASAGTMAQLREAAVKAGADTQYSAVEAAQGITEMSKAGVQAKDILGGGLAGALNLAAAGQISVAEAAETGATALSVFNLEGDQMSHVADLLAAGAGKAQGSVGDMSAALNQSALVAHQTGLSIEDTAGALAMFASNGLIGSDAGTSFKTMLQALTPNSKQAAEAMADIGFSAYDAQGNFVGLQGVAGQLRAGLAGLTEEQRNTTLETIFGSDAVRAASVLYSQGAQGVAEWAGKVDDAGYAQKQASQLTDNLRGDLERLGGAVDSTFTSIGDGVQGPLRMLVQGLTGVLNAGGDVLSFFGNLPGSVQASVVTLGAMAALNGPLTGVLGVLRGFGSGLGSSIGGTFSAFGEALGYARANGEGLSTVLRSVGSYAGGELKSSLASLVSFFGGPWGLAITAVVGSYALLRSATDDSSAATQAAARVTERAATAQQSYKQALEATNGVIDESVRRSAAKALQDEGLLSVAKDLDISTQSMTDSVLGNKGAYEQILPVLEAYYNSLLIQSGYDRTDATDKKAAAVKAQIEAYKELVGTHPDVVASEQEIATATGETGAAMGASAAQTEEAAKAQEEWLNKVSGALQSFVDPLDAYKGLLEEKTTAEREQAEATAAATESSKDSWKDYVKDVDLSLDELATRLEQQLTDQANWRTNIAKIAQWAGEDVANYLLEMGEDGVDIVAKMANGTTAGAKRMATDIKKTIQTGGGDWAAGMDNATKVMAAIGKAGAKATVVGISEQLGIGADVVAKIAAQYGVKLATGINPVLSAIGKKVITINQKQDGRRYIGVTAGFSDGGYTGPGGKYTPAGFVHAGEIVWSQDDIAAHGGVQRVESMRRARKGYASGGFVTPESVPHPPSTTPYRPPLSTAADGVMAKEYADVRAWIGANAFSVAPGPGGSVERWRPVVLRALAMLGQSPALANGVLRMIAAESGGNPNAINLWDSNARAGHPSRGLMQTIPGTFEAWRSHSLPDNIVDPLANIYSGINYALHRYGAGMLAAGGRKSASGGYLGYAAGGTTPAGQPFWVGENGPELMWSNREQYVSTAAQSREVSGAAAAMPGYGVGSVAYGPGPARPLVVSLAGATVTGRFEFGSDGLVRLVDGRIDGKLGDLADTIQYAGG